MKENRTKKLCVAGILCAVAVVGSMFSIPVFGSKCAPVQHMVNILCAVLLGPWYGVAVAFGASLIRNLMGLGSLLAFPGSMFGALLCAYPVAIALMGVSAGEVAFYAYVIPFLVSTVGGALLSAILIGALRKTGILESFQASVQ